jgi:hypothetical protein
MTGKEERRLYGQEKKPEQKPEQGVHLASLNRPRYKK